MKPLRTPLLCVFISLSSLYSFAQKQVHTIPLNEPDLNRPRLFQGLPDNIPVSVDNLVSLLNTPVGNTVAINLSDKLPFKFEGQVVSAVSKYDNNIQSVVINSSNYNGASLTFSKTSNVNGTISYSGRIVSFRHGDLFELQNQNGRFVLVKRKFHDLVSE